MGVGAEIEKHNKNHDFRFFCKLRSSGDMDGLVDN